MFMTKKCRWLAAVACSAFASLVSAEALLPGQSVEVEIPAVPAPIPATPGVDPVHAQTPQIRVEKRCVAGVVCVGPTAAEPQTLATTPALDSIALVPRILVRLEVAPVFAPAGLAPMTVPPTTVWLPNPAGDDIPVEICPQRCEVLGPADTEQSVAVTVTIQAGEQQLRREIVLPSDSWRRK